MKKIELTQNKYAIVDDEDYEYLNQWKWCCGGRYATRQIKVHCGKQRQTTIPMHRVVNKTPDGMDTDHINHNGLDNRKCNLRTCTSRQNLGNSVISKNNTSGYKGVHWSKRDKRWYARIKDNGVKKHIGVYDTPEEAHAAYQREAKIVFKEFCNS